MRFLRHSVQLLFWLCFCVSALAQSPTPAPTPADPATFSLISGRDPAATLIGKWRFQPGDDPRYADPAFDDSRWALLKSNRSWFEQGHKGYSGYAWYRFRVILPAGNAPFKIALSPMLTSYQIFIDGRLVRTVGTMGSTRLYTTRSVVLPLSTQPRATPETITVAVRIWHAPKWAGYTGGGPVTASVVGLAPQIDEEIRLYGDDSRLDDSDDFGLGAFALLSGATALILFLIRRSAREYLWLALLCFAFASSAFFTYFSNPYIMNLELTETVHTFFNTLSRLALIFFVSNLFESRLTWLSRTAIVAVLLEFIIEFCCYWFSFLPVYGLSLCSAILQVVLYTCLLVLLARKSRSGDLDAKLLLFPISLYALVLVTANVLPAISQVHGRGLSFSLWRLTIQYPFPITLGDIVSFLLFLGLLAVLLNRFARTSREQDRIASDLESARTLQQVLIPETLPTIPGIIIATAYHPAQEVGGDFFQIIPLPNGDTLIVLGDVSGKGLPAAMTVSLIVGALRTIVDFTSSPAAILASLNRRLHNRGLGFTTCVALRISPSGLLTIANAGHLNPYLNGKELETDAALPLGLDPDLTLSERTCQTAPSDHLTLITDGVLEATDHEGKLFGFDRTLNSSAQSATHIATLARDFGQSDDITVLTLDFA